MAENPKINGRHQTTDKRNSENIEKVSVLKIAPSYQTFKLLKIKTNKKINLEISHQG